MELFVIKNRKSLEVLQGFNNKMDAKKLRNELNGPEQSEVIEDRDFIVSPGKDHPDYNKKVTVKYKGKRK